MLAAPTTTQDDDRMVHTTEATFRPEVGSHPCYQHSVASLELGSVVSSLAVDVRTLGGSLLLQAIKNRYTIVPGLQYRVNFTGLRSSLAYYFAPLSS